MNNFYKEMNKRAEQAQKKRWKITLFILSVLGLIATIVFSTIGLIRNPPPPPPPKDITGPNWVQPPPPPPPPALQPILSFTDFEEVYFEVGKSHIEEKYVDKVLSLLNRVPSEKEMQNPKQPPCQIFIACSGDSRGTFEYTQTISRQRACEVKIHIAEKLEGMNKARWDRAQVWSFGTIVTPGLPREDGEDFNCGCIIYATTDGASIEARYRKKLEEAVSPYSSDLKRYEVKDAMLKKYLESHK